ncbi:MAG: hypothetical protein P1V97_29070 [Planctomycetota bacterium]|nr:hypothetical protein [Planctomycetota bacterium]
MASPSGRGYRCYRVGTLVAGVRLRTMSEEYNDENEEADYVWRYYSDLRTPLERRCASVIFFRFKFKEPMGRKPARIFKEAGGRDPEVLAELAEGHATFIRRAVRRILREHGEEIVINRCPECGCVVKTPTATQCLWCNHSWHFVNNSKTL